MNVTGITIVVVFVEVCLRILLVVVLRVLHDAQAKLLKVGLATGATRIFPGTGKNRE